MTLPAKATDRKRFLQYSFLKQQSVFNAKLELAGTSITHFAKRGNVTEKHFIELLRAHLPNRYAADSAFVIDSEGRTSEQIDVVIYDQQYIPVLLKQADHRYVLSEAVYAVLEVKPKVNKPHLAYAAKKAASVRRLTRTSLPIPHAGGIYPPKRPFPIAAGLVATRAEWKDGLGHCFQKALESCTGDSKLDCVLSLNDGAYDAFNKDGSPTFSPKQNSLVFFLFRLLHHLQSLGTVPAVDWNAYAGQVSAATSSDESKRQKAWRTV